MYLSYTINDVNIPVRNTRKTSEMSEFSLKEKRFSFHENLSRRQPHLSNTIPNTVFRLAQCFPAIVPKLLNNAREKLNAKRSNKTQHKSWFKNTLNLACGNKRALTCSMPQDPQNSDSNITLLFLI